VRAEDFRKYFWFLIHEQQEEIEMEATAACHS